MDRFKIVLLCGIPLVVAVAAGRQSFDDVVARPRPLPVDLLSPPNTGTAPASAPKVAAAPMSATAAAPADAAKAETAAAKTTDNGETPDDYVYPGSTNGARRVVSAGPPATRTKAVVPLSATRRSSASATTPNYERSVADAVTLSNEDVDRAARRLERITVDEPTRPEAFETLAAVRLRQGDYYQAFEMFNSAVRQGGKATFAILHDHTRGNFDSDPKATCAAELSIMPAGVRLEGAEGHRFAATWTELQEAGANRFFGSSIGGFHVKVSAEAGKSKNFNLAPRSKDKREANLILDLLIEHAQRHETGR